MVTKGSEYEFWQEGSYNTFEHIHRCFAYKIHSNGDFIQMAQGTGSDCNGMRGNLNLNDNAFRQLSLTKHKEISNCQFPDWVTQNTWKVIPRGGIRPEAVNDQQQQSRQVSFPNQRSFILGAEGTNFGQKFKCAQIVNSSSNEVYVQTFTQSQCYGEYHCFHATLTEDNFVEIHVGAPTPNIEHSCLKPSFDISVPYLLATLVPDFDMTGIANRPQDVSPQMRPEMMPMNSNGKATAAAGDSLESKEDNLKKIGQHAMNLLQQYQSDFNSKLQSWVGEFINQIQLLLQT